MAHLTYNRFVSKKSAEKVRKSKSNRTRQRILDAAARVLSTKGFAGTRLADVATLAELQAPAIYYYFPSREELVEEVMWVGIARIREHVAAVLAALPAGTDPLERIDTAVTAHLRFELELSDYTTAAIRNAGQVPEHIRLRYSKEATEYGAIWHTLVQDAHDNGLVRDDIDLRVARMMVLGALNWAAEWWHPGGPDIERVVTTAQSVIRSGLGTTGQREPHPVQRTDSVTVPAAAAVRG